MAEKNSSANGGIGFFGLLGILFIALKLTGVIDWSWWFVLLPVYGPFMLVLLAILLLAMGEIPTRKRRKP